MKVVRNNIVMEEGATVDSRDLSEDGKILDARTYARVPNTIVTRDANSFSALTAEKAVVLNTPRTIKFIGGVQGSFVFDGGEDIEVPLQVSNDSSGEWSHNHDDLYYKKDVLDEIFSQLSDLNPSPSELPKHIHAIIRNGEGLAFFNYNTSENVTINVSWAGITGDYGVDNLHVARSDHKHDKIYYTKTEIDSSGGSLTLISSGNYLQLINKNGQVISQVEISTSLTLSPGAGKPGLPLMSTDNNNEANKVLRTDDQGYTKVKGIIITSPESTNAPQYIWVDDGSGKLVRSSIQNVMVAAGVSGNDVTQHYHTEIKTKTNTSIGIFAQLESQFNTNLWRIRSSQGDNTSVYHASNANHATNATNASYATNAGFASKANYADLAENYKVKGNLAIGTLVQVSKDKEFELEEFNNYPSKPIGVISSKPGFLLNAQDEGKEFIQPIALHGKTPVRIKGAVEKGDPLIPSENGIATKLKYISDSTYIFAYALESNEDEKEKLVMCVVGV